MMNFQNQIDYLQIYESVDMLGDIAIPEPLQLETLKNQIIFRCGLLTPTYSEPHVMKAAIDQFFTRENWNINHLVKIILAEYSPIENTDRYSTHTTDRTGSETTTHSGKDQRDIRDGGTQTRDIQESGTTQEEATVSAYNASSYQPDNKVATTHGKKTDDDITFGKTVDDDLTYGHVVGTESEGSDEYTEHTHGNIGVTTNQELINQELELLRSFDVYDWIAAKLENELFIQVY